MDLETENRIAAMLLKEAAELRRQADQEGVLAYLRRPNVRVRPNSQFLTSTVRGVEQECGRANHGRRHVVKPLSKCPWHCGLVTRQRDAVQGSGACANRAVEMNEMWRARQKERELDNRSIGKSSNGSAHHRPDSHNKCGNLPCSSGININDGRDGPDDDEGLKDDEVEEFLRSRAKRGRGSIGSRMGEVGPYPSQASDQHVDRLLGSHLVREEISRGTVLGPKKPSWKSVEFSEDSESEDDDRRKRSKKHHSKKHKSKEKKSKKKKHRHEKRHRQ